MKIDFNKYHGAGNDFIMIDGFRYSGLAEELKEAQVKLLCDRHFGIGADGLIILQPHDNYDFEMVYYNSDGRLSSMCGNGGRCILRYARALGYIGDSAQFLAVDGPHEGTISRHVSLKMSDVEVVETIGQASYFLDTGSPHYVQFSKDIVSMDLIAEARKIRYSDRFEEQGTNVNFVEETKAGISLRTYERGVEDETLACGTGVVASALAFTLRSDLELNPVNVMAVGGKMEVSFKRSKEGFSNIWLIGPAEAVFQGSIDII